MRRWRYKTLHFQLKKDGILGNFFLDEEELEQSLCRHGRDGWELVTVLDVQDGLVALCKQPFLEENLADSEPLAKPLAASGWEEGEAPMGAEAEPLVKSAAKPPEPERPAERPAEWSSTLFGESDDEDEALSAGPSIDAGGDEEGSGLSNIKIE